MASWTEKPRSRWFRPARRNVLPALPWKRRLTRALISLLVTVTPGRDRRARRNRALARCPNC
jgi:hypothetical protein